ncbi:MAG TPA: flagellar basal body protein [Caulobacteraceae bacterium]|jgi:hypothetical protein|nr:flagellar basal body protein [Caulobacteraceae bacterium]
MSLADEAAAAIRVEQLIQLTERLTALIAAQAQAFEAHRPQEAAARLEEVSRLANFYRREASEVRQAPGLVAQAPAAARQKLIRATEAFDAVMARQGRALAAAKTVTEGIVRAVAEEVAAQRNAGLGYGPGARASAGSATAITLNQRA